MVVVLFLCWFHVHCSCFFLFLVVAGLVFAVMLAQVPISFLLVFLFAVFAMGAMNMMFELDGEVCFGFTYMIGMLVKFVYGFVFVIIGEDRWCWLSYLALWSGFVGGGIVTGKQIGRAHV